MLKSIRLQDFLSYGPGSTELDLEPLNVLIGPNGSGKSNLVEAFAVLRAVPRDLPLPIRRGGGVEEWLWRHGRERAREATLEILFEEGEVHDPPQGLPVRYRLTFGSEAGAFVVLDERLENGSGEPRPFLFFGYEKGRPMITVKGGKKRRLERAHIDRTQSILSQRRDPENYPELSRVSSLLADILIYRAWSFGPESAIREACLPDVTTHLLEDFSNLPARLTALKKSPSSKRRLLEALAEFDPGATDLEVVVEGGRLQLYVTEGDRNVPAHRLSDGTLRFLALSCILLDPGPARLVVIEEPELGLHPDVFPVLRDLMVEASQHCQLIVTTHSTQLVDAMTEHPNRVVVCEKPDGKSRLRRLEAAEIERWKEFGTLGTLWMSGRLGGTRW